MSTKNWPPQDGRPHLIVVGAGFAGLNLTRALRNAPIYITLVDKSNHHLFQPLLYQVAAAALSPNDIAAPIRAIFRKQKNVRVLMDRVSEVRAAEKSVAMKGGEILKYDYLALATGAKHSYFGHPEWEASAPGLKSINDALRMRQKILASFERAEATFAHSATNTSLKRLLTFVIIGGGPTGVELAGSIAEIAFKTLRDEFRGIDPRDARILLLEAGDRLLSAFPGDLGISAQKALEKLGVEVRTKCMVADVSPQGVKIGEEFIETSNIFWAAGNIASTLLKTIGTELDSSGRAIVQGDLTLKDHPAICVLGDSAHFADSKNANRPVPAVAPAAIQQGQYTAKRLKAILKNKAYPDFQYWDKGSMATIGRGRAVAMVGRLHFTGLIAWLAWSLIHVLYLVGFRNRIAVMSIWIYSYLTNKRAVRLITSDDL